MSLSHAFNTAAGHDNTAAPIVRAQPTIITTPVKAKDLRAKKKDDDGSGKPGGRK